MKHIGWFILDKNGLVFLYLPKQMYFTGDVTDKALAFAFQHLMEVYDGWLPMKQPSTGKVLVLMVADVPQKDAAAMAYGGVK